MAWTFDATEAGYNKLWKAAQLKASEANQAELFANKIIAAETRYKAVQARTGVPWFFIGALHMRESSNSFAGVLHNGDRIIGTGGLTVRVPAGRGPFSTWEDSAVDALKLKDMQRVQVWSAARMLYQAEVFNGLGYIPRGINSPYVWGGTTNEQRGKYVADHVFDPNAEDTQLGVAAVLIRLAQKRPDINAVLYPPASAGQQEPPVPETDQAAEIIETLNSLRSLPKLIADLTASVNALRGIAPPVTPPPVVAPPVVVTPSTPILDRPGVGLGALGGVISMVLGLLGAPVTEGAGLALPAASLASAALGATGWGAVAMSAIRILGEIMTRQTPAK
jgi:lysozyme family protein